ncbi:TPA: hypothetical protein ACX6S1_003381 [Photobacterium damselae]
MGGKERIGSILLYRTEGGARERRKRRFGGDEEEREKGEEKVWGMRKSGEMRESKKLDPRRYGIKL